MLTRLSIRHFVLVDQLDLDWRPGFTALTGETGAGKSIVLDALELVLGGRADPGAIRPGEERAELVAHFEPAHSSAASRWLDEQALSTPDHECLLRRVVEKSGKSRAFINGTPVTASQLRELGERLIDIHGQHAHQHLLHSAAQRSCLDAFGHHEATLEQVSQSWRRWVEAQAALKTAQQQWQTAQEQRLEWEELLTLLSPLSLDGLSWDVLQQEHQRWTHRADLQSGVSALLERLEEGQQAVRRQLFASQQQLESLLTQDSSLHHCLTLLESARIEVEEAVTWLEHYQRETIEEDDRLPALDAQLSARLACARRLRCHPEELLAQWAETRRQLDALGALPDPLTLQTEAQQAQAAWQQAAQELSAQRQSAAQRLSREVTACLSDLALGQGRFAVHLEPLESPGSLGAERVVFYFAAHSSQTLAPLQKVASGGELARLGLALQTRLSQDTAVPTLIFDEVDSGIGGAVAQRVGQMLAELGQHLQVLCVTHLAQVAASAHHQWSVSKQEQQGQMTSQVRCLGNEDRIEEIARMLGGVTLTDTVRQHARELLNRHASASP